MRPARLERKKVLEFIVENKWPCERKFLKNRGLWSAIMDKELIENQKNKLAILPSLLGANGRRSSSLLGSLESHRRSSSFEIETDRNSRRDSDQVSGEQNGSESSAYWEERERHSTLGLMVELAEHCRSPGSILNSKLDLNWLKCVGLAFYNYLWQVYSRKF